MHPFVLCFVCIFFMNGAACRSIPFPRIMPLEDAAAQKDLVSALGRPRESRSLHRVVFERRGIEIDLTLVVALRPPASLRIIALSDLGGTVFDLLRTEQKTEVIRESPFLTNAFLSEQLSEDMALLLLPPSSELLRLSVLESGTHVLSAHLGPNRNGRTYLYGTETAGTLRQYERGVNGRSIATATILQFDEDTRHPIKYSIEGRRDRYQLRGEVVEYDDLKLSDDVFQWNSEHTLKSGK